MRWRDINTKVLTWKTFEKIKNHEPQAIKTFTMKKFN